VGLGGAVPDAADLIISIPETKATLLRSIKPMTKTKAPVTRKTGCQRVRANRRMPMTDSSAPVRSHQRVLPCVYRIVRFLGAALYPVLSNSGLDPALPALTSRA
jgi:hypothetical protein